MPSRIGIILASHGALAIGALDSLNMILGVTEDIQTVTVTPEMSREAVETAYLQCFHSLSGCDKFIVCLDILSGTPCNVASQFYLTRNDVHMVAGFNLAILAEIIGRVQAGDDDISGILADVQTVFPKSLSIFSKEETPDGN